jgi:hypothetical protein
LPTGPLLGAEPIVRSLVEFDRGSGLLRSSGFSSVCLRVNQKNRSRQVVGHLEFELLSKSRRSKEMA